MVKDNLVACNDAVTGIYSTEIIALGVSSRSSCSTMQSRVLYKISRPTSKCNDFHRVRAYTVYEVSDSCQQSTALFLTTVLNFSGLMMVKF